MPAWRRTLYTLWFTQFIAVAGFSFVTPFLAYYIQELGVTGAGRVSLWAGVATSAMAIGMGIMAPIWGILADRHGRKPMVLRATFAGSLIMALMGLVVTVQQLTVLRFVQGLFTGTISAATTLVAAIVPKEHAGFALGSLQTAVYLGVSLGPLLGGLTGDQFGYRPSFWITALLLFSSGLLVAFFVREDSRPLKERPGHGWGGYGIAFRLVLASGPLLALFAARMLLRAGTRAVDPVLPLFVQNILPPGAAVGTTVGMITAASTVGAALGAPVVGGWGDRGGHRRILILSAAFAAVFYLPQAFVENTWWLAVWQFLSGFAVGGTLSTLTALLAQITPSGHEGVVFGLDASAVSAATAVGPLAGALTAAAFGLGASFVLASVTFGLGLLVVVLWVRERSASYVEEGAIQPQIVTKQH